MGAGIMSCHNYYACDIVVILNLGEGFFVEFSLMLFCCFTYVDNIWIWLGV